jgi:drug/metabolite transporter (DMT)-like permease
MSDVVPRRATVVARLWPLVAGRGAEHLVTTGTTTSPSRRGLVPVGVRPWLGAVLISFSAVWIRLADVEVARSAFLRGAYALPALAVLLAWHTRGVPAGERRRLWLLPWSLVAGGLMGIDLVAWHASIEILGAGLATVLPNLQVVFVGIAGVLFFGERPRRTFWVAVPIIFAGIWVLAVVGRPVAADASVPLGVFYGVVAGVTYAGMLVFLRVSRGRRPHAPGVAFLFSLTLAATLITGTAAASQGVAAPAGWPADGWLLLLALGSQVAGWLLLASSIHLLPAAATSVALLLQPVLALVWGGLLLGEPLGPPQLTGAAVVLVGVVLAHRSVAAARVRPLPYAPEGAA